jgi:thiosulfate/3-mercaptopyruvate sulfurtransferase
LKSVASIRARYLAAGLKPGAKVIVYCNGGIQASYDYFTLKLAGFHPVLYAGSFAEWDAAFGTRVETGSD